MRSMFARVAELADALDLGSSAARRVGSSPSSRIPLSCNDLRQRSGGAVRRVRGRLGDQSCRCVAVVKLARSATAGENRRHVLLSKSLAPGYSPTRPFSQLGNGPRVNRPLTNSELAAIERSIRQRVPLGSPEWIARTANRLGLEHPLRSPGASTACSALTGPQVRQCSERLQWAEPIIRHCRCRGR
jgi:hypothetical protein